MRVDKFTKLKNGMYKLTLENKEIIIVHEELILKKDILLNRYIDEEDIKNIDKLNNNYNAYDIAIKYISTKYRSCFEVEEFLEKKEVSKDVIDDVIKRLKNQKYLDDEVYAKAFVNDRINFSNNGPYKIKKELEEKKVDESIIDKVLVVFSDDLQKEKLEKLVPKYMKTIRNKSQVMAKNKTKEYFLNLGYNTNIVIKILEETEFDDSDNRKKEYDKLYKKLSKKYSGSELDFKIKQAMYQKGYR